MRYTLVLATVLTASCSVAFGGTFGVYGVSELSCGKYINELSTDPLATNAYGWWVAGFVSGTNLEKGRSLSTDSPAHEAWLKRYCEKNPLDAFVKAAIELNKELDKRRSK